MEQWDCEDIISCLPQKIIEYILMLMPIRDAVRTSVLSTKWPRYWKSMPKLVFNDEVVQVPSDLLYMKGYIITDFILTTLLAHKGPILEFEYAGQIGIDNGLDQILLYLSQLRFVKKCIFNFSFHPYKLPSFFCSLQGLESLEFKNCIIELPYTFDGFSMLRSLSIIGVNTARELEYVKPIMEKSPMLENVRIELNHSVSVDEELKIREDFMRPCGSASTKLKIERS